MAQSTESLEDWPEILERSPEEGARRLALSYLDAAAAALPRLSDLEDDEALHDLRVALRRLRSCLKACTAQLGDSVPEKLARRLRRLARATGPGRDAEVQVAWLREQGPEVVRRNRQHRQGLTWMLARLERRKEASYGELRGEVEADFAPVEEGLRRRLSVYRAEVRLDESRPPTFGEAAADILREHAAMLDRRLGRVTAAGEVQRAHTARISAKRLRYFADPLTQLVGAGNGQARAGGLVHGLKALQDLLGELHDAHVLESELAAALGEAAAERARRLLELSLAGGEMDQHQLRVERRRAQEPGLLALARLNRSRRDRLFAELAERWQGARTQRLLAAAEELAAALQAAGHAGPVGAAPPAEGNDENAENAENDEHDEQNESGARRPAKGGGAAAEAGQ
jgi:CHAD domain-containing protein